MFEIIVSSHSIVGVDLYLLLISEIPDLKYISQGIFGSKVGSGFVPLRLWLFGK